MHDSIQHIHWIEDLGHQFQVLNTSANRNGYLMSVDNSSEGFSCGLPSGTLTQEIDVTSEYYVPQCGRSVE